MSAETYEKDLAAWKARHGITTPGDDAPDGEELMAIEDAKRPGRDYCVHCGERFRIADMRLITRRDDPYMQFDEDRPGNKPEWYIQVQYRVRACKPCFKTKYESDDET